MACGKLDPLVITNECSPPKKLPKFDFYLFSKNSSLTASESNAPKIVVPQPYPGQVKGANNIPLSPADPNSESTDYPLSEKGKKLQLANICYISDSKVERLGSLEHTKPIKAVAKISFEQAPLNIPIVNSVFLAESTIAFTDDIPSESGIYSDLEDDEVLYYIKNDYGEPYIENDIS